MDEFIAELRLLKAWAGNPSITEITRRVHKDWQRAGRPRSEWPARSTIGNCFQLGRRRPNSDLLLAVVCALVDGDQAAVAGWRQSLRTILGEAEAAARINAYDRLPGGLPCFVGRSELVAETETRLAAQGRGPTVALEGTAGVGKTSLAIRVAHRLLARGRTDGRVLFANLRGFAPHDPPADPSAVLEAFLRLLGVPGDRIPYSLNARASMYRQRLAGTAALIVLDDAVGEEQLRPLLPGDRTCRTLVTSRRALPGLTDVARLSVPPFTPTESQELLRREAGTALIEADEPAVCRIADQLGHLPLALTVIGRHMREHPGWVLGDYHTGTLTTLALEDGVRALLAASDARLPKGARGLLRLLALHPLDDLDAVAAAALADESDVAVQQHLDALFASHLVRETSPGWFRVHALVHAYAAERVCIDVPATRIRQALGRVLEHYTGKAATHGVCRRAGAMPIPALTRARHTGVWAETPLPAAGRSRCVLAA